MTIVVAVAIRAAPLSLPPTLFLINGRRVLIVQLTWQEAFEDSLRRVEQVQALSFAQDCFLP